MSLSGARASALLQNGDFQLGNTGFTSVYKYVAPDNNGVLNPEGFYTLTTNPNNVHSLFSSFGDHTTGTGLMLVANGNNVADTVVWQGQLSQPLVVGQAYAFTFWARSAYASSPAELSFHIGADQIGTMLLPASTAEWVESTTYFVAQTTNPVINIRDDNAVEQGNDFALDDISLTDGVPEPSTSILLGAGLAALIAARRRIGR